jgi:hypothetical protein
MNTAALLADAMIDYVLTVGVNGAAPAAGAPEHMTAWLEAPRLPRRPPLAGRATEPSSLPIRITPATSLVRPNHGSYAEGGTR